MSTEAKIKHLDLSVFERLPAHWSYWDGKRYQLFVHMPRDLDGAELGENLRTLNLIRRQVLRQLRNATHVDRIEEAINQGLAVEEVGEAS